MLTQRLRAGLAYAAALRLEGGVGEWHLELEPGDGFVEVVSSLLARPVVVHHSIYLSRFVTLFHTS